MALREYKDGQYREIGGMNKREDGETKPLSALYQCVGGVMRLLWSAIQYITAWSHGDAWRHGEPW